MRAVTAFLDGQPRLRGIRSENAAPGVTAESAAEGLARREGTVVLLSGGRLDCARYHIVGAAPWLTVTAWGRRMRLAAGDRVLETEADPFEVVRAVLDRFALPAADPEIPVTAGLMGYLAYDLKDRIETLPRTSVDRWRLPHVFLCAPSILLVQDLLADRTRVFLPEGEGLPDIRRRIGVLSRGGADAPGGTTGFSCGVDGFVSNFRRPDYLEAVGRIRDYIAAGDVYQVNMSQRFETSFSGDPFALFQSLFRRNPAPFFAFVNAGDHQIVSTSPERFLLRRGSRIETRPIKGTRPRGATPEDDAALREALRTSPKDDAELSMIVDLLRNDIGKVCAAGTVRVAEHKRIEAYENVYHLVSIVEGRLAGRCDTVDLLRATFPGGSITGCPKIRAMEIIDELEPDRRHVYTGAIGYLSFHDTLDLSVAIRTAAVCRGRLAFSVGGGIVFDSDPEAEYEETLHKGKSMLEVFECRREAGGPSPVVWSNGHLIPAHRACVPVDDQGVLYGNGCFETLRVEGGRVLRLSAHIDRFRGTWRFLFGPEPFPDLTWEDVIQQVLERNGLVGRTAAVRVTATRGNPDAPGLPPSLFVTARAYRHRLEGSGREGLRIATYPHPRLSPLADHKTLNYLYYLRAGQWARSRDADEALVLNPDGTVSETNTANLIVVAGREAVRPLSPHVLPGVMETAVVALLEGDGYTVTARPMAPSDLLRPGAEVVATNALMGAVPVVSLDGRPLPAATALTGGLNRRLFGTAAG